MRLTVSLGPNLGFSDSVVGATSTLFSERDNSLKNNNKIVVVVVVVVLLCCCIVGQLAYTLLLEFEGCPSLDSQEPVQPYTPPSWTG